MRGRRVYVECPDYRVGLKQVPNRVMYLLELLAMVLLGVSFGIPEADADNSIGFRVGNQHDFVNEAALFFENRHGLLIDGVCQFFCLSGFACEFDYACKHVLAPFFG
jgi:hypothetical protein